MMSCTSSGWAFRYRSEKDISSPHMKTMVRSGRGSTPASMSCLVRMASSMLRATPVALSSQPGSCTWAANTMRWCCSSGLEPLISAMAVSCPWAAGTSGSLMPYIWPTVATFMVTVHPACCRVRMALYWSGEMFHSTMGLPEFMACWLEVAPAPPAKRAELVYHSSVPPYQLSYQSVMAGSWAPNQLSSIRGLL